MRFLNPHDARVSHVFGRFTLAVEPGETSEDVPEEYAQFVAIVGSKLVPAPEAASDPAAEPAPEADTSEASKPASKAKGKAKAKADPVPPPPPPEPVTEPDAPAATPTA